MENTGGERGKRGERVRGGEKREKEETKGEWPDRRSRGRLQRENGKEHSR
jgi:hypothetical protein